MLEDSPCLLRGLWVASASHASCAIANRDHGLRDSSPVITGCFHGRLFAGESTVDYYEEPAGARGSALTSWCWPRCGPPPPRMGRDGGRRAADQSSVQCGKKARQTAGPRQSDAVWAGRGGRGRGRGRHPDLDPEHVGPRPRRHRRQMNDFVPHLHPPATQNRPVQSASGARGSHVVIAHEGLPAHAPADCVFRCPLRLTPPTSKVAKTFPCGLHFEVRLLNPTVHG